MIPQRVTLRDIAKRLGVHFTTVGLALRNSPRVKTSTRLRVQKLAKKLGYAPDPWVASLNAYRQAKSAPHYQATIAWINNWHDRHHMLSIPEFREYYDGAMDRARERGYLLEEFWLKEKGMSAEVASQIFRARNIQGVLLAPQGHAQEILPFAYENLSVVAFGYSNRPAVFHVVTNHHFHTINMMLEKLSGLGYKRAGICIDEHWDDKVENAFIGGSSLWGWRHPHQIVVRSCSETVTTGFLGEWIRNERIDVIVSSRTIIPKLRALKLKIPKDIGYANIALYRNEPHFSGIYQNDWLIGRQSVDLIVDMIHRGERGIPEIPIRTLVESTWYPGKTLCSQKRAHPRH